MNRAEYRRKLEGCFLGKSVGGTLGGPYEGQEGPLSLTYYDPVPQEMMPNDDLDLQVVWLETIRRKGLPICRRMLADAWLENIHMFPDEYGVAHKNILHGIYPPMSGAYDNDFVAGMGAAIRSEIWACLAPGCPDLAARLAREDACADHDGDGVDACVFFAVVESYAFVENDQEALLEKGFSYLPEESRVKQAMLDAKRWWEKLGDWLVVREQIRKKYAVDNWTDVAMNLAYIMLGWLAGEGDFGKSICIANNCGGDTDCTAATLGALLGLIDPDGIDDKWTEPIGGNLVLSPSMVGLHPCATLDEFCDQLEQLAAHVLSYYGEAVTPQDTQLPAWDGMPPLYANGEAALLREGYAPFESQLAIAPLIVTLVYPQGYVFLPDKPEQVQLRLRNPLDRQAAGQVLLGVPYGWRVAPAQAAFDLAPGGETVIPLTIAAPGTASIRTCSSFLDIRMDVDGLRWTISAGLPQSIPWRRDGIVVEAAGHTQIVPAGKHSYVTEFKVPHVMTACYLAQAKGTVSLRIDGKEVIAHSSGLYVPAFHRNEGTGVEVTLEKGWHRAEIVVDAEAETPLYFGIGVAGRRTGGYVLDMEWRQVAKG